MKPKSLRLWHLVKGVKKACEEVKIFFPEERYKFSTNISSLWRSGLYKLYNEKELEYIGEVTGFKTISFGKKIIKRIVDVLGEKDVAEFINSGENINERRHRILLVANLCTYLNRKSFVLSSIQLIKTMGLEKKSGIISGFVPAIRHLERRKRFAALAIFISKLKNADEGRTSEMQVRYATNPHALLRGDA